MLFPRPIVALDIGSFAIKAVELTGSKNKVLRKLGSERLPEGTLHEGRVQDQTAITKALKRLLKRLHLRSPGRRAALALGGASVIIKRASFPNKDELELADLIDAEAEQYFQHSLSELYFTWHAEPCAVEAREKTVILVGAKRDLVDEHIALIKAAGLRVGVVDCDVFAVYNMFTFNFGKLPGLIALTQIGAASTQITLVSDGHYLYTRNIALGGNTYTKALASALGWSTERAEALKIALSQGLLPPPAAVLPLIQELNQELAGEIQTTFDFFFQSTDAPPGEKLIKGIFLCGGAAQTLQLAEQIAASTKTGTKLLNPFYQVSLPPPYESLKRRKEAVAYGAALGLALQKYPQVL